MSGSCTAQLCHQQHRILKPRLHDVAANRASQQEGGDEGRMEREMKEIERTGEERDGKGLGNRHTKGDTHTLIKG